MLNRRSIFGLKQEFFLTKITNSGSSINALSNGKGYILPRQLPPLLLLSFCNIIGACLGKFGRIDYGRNGNGLTSIILDSE